MLTDEERHKMHNFKIALRENDGALSKSSCHWLIDKVNEQEKAINNLKSLNEQITLEADTLRKSAKKKIESTIDELKNSLVGL